MACLLVREKMQLIASCGPPSSSRMRRVASATNIATQRPARLGVGFLSEDIVPPLLIWWDGNPVMVVVFSDGRN